MQELITSIKADRLKISAVIPAYNEETTISDIVSKALRYVDEIVVIDEGSTDDTAQKARDAGAIVIRNRVNKGFLHPYPMGSNLHMVISLSHLTPMDSTTLTRFLF